MNASEGTKIKGLRWWIIALISLATVINYIDRSALGVMWWAEGDCIAKDLGYTTADIAKQKYAIILNVFMVFYAIGQSVTGRVFDKVGTRIGFVLSIFVWSLSTMFHALARGVLSFSIFRGTLAVGEAGNWPGAVKSNAEWFPQQERAVAQGLFNAGASIGSVISPPLIAFMFIAIGWKVTFVVVGILGLLWIIPWMLINKSAPESHPWITEEEKKYILGGRPAVDNNATEEKAMTISEIVSHKASWSVLIARFFHEPIWWLFVGWMPIYLAATYGFNVKEIGAFAWVPYVGAALGSVAGGWYSGKLIASGKAVGVARKTAITIGSTLMFLGLVSTIFFADTPEKFVGIVAIVLFGFQFSIGNVQTIPSDILKGSSVASLAGMGGTVGVFSVIIMNFLIPIFTSQSFTPAFVIIALFVPLGVLAVFFFGGKLESVK
ncbi:MAG: MFS transporter [Candidatus Marinimicrobia bacterium]|jgi:MFS transporter, ACS family, hexuronate transporter|nr:MFS transporter [Candidatus Neomarinimicrobiota bacterium]MBT4035311.1 MFS transporter [Candidatus Neomarinimicrobiota bacterium]MBT4359716.1 MFS transporter [Candidatus Neomarinimicrobiota bacterium]MBT4713728.1 MFS transporter [Candidatus Neomarinimicrobiota bacterium]MBT4946920.1 MFS transporter [Candidatus Neomarinimicrobiota bacterium]